MTTPSWKRVSAEIDRAGESPIWDWRSGRLYWVDAQTPCVRALDLDTGREDRWPAPAPIGCIGLAGTDSLVVATDRAFHLLDCERGSWSPLATIHPPLSGYRLNDGKVDRGGRLLVGSLFDGAFASDGALYRVDGAGRIETLFGGLAISNSNCFSPDGRTFYTGDTATARIDAYSYDPQSGCMGERRLFADVREIFGAMPDGATTDSDGNVWVALVDRARIACLAPDGTAIRVVETPMEYPSCPAFGGKSLDILFVTSISDPRPHAPLPATPDSGALFALSGLGVTGLREPIFGGIA